jgi:zinc transport system substrate-binding protein
MRVILRAAVECGVGLFLLVGAASACSSGPAAADDEGLDVVAGFYPLQEAAERIGGDRITVTNLTAPGVEPHDLELAPDDLEAIATADVVLIVGGGFQPALEEAVTEAEGVVLDALDELDTLPPPEGEHADGVASADPHVWLDPTVFVRVVALVAETFAEVDPGGADSFARNAETYTAELAELDREFRHGLAECTSRIIVVNHAAFAYLARAYDLDQQAISGVSPEAEPDPRRLAELRGFVVREGIGTIFTEELVSPDVAEALADEAGVSTTVLNPLEGLTPDEVEAGEDYRSVMRRNLDALRDGLGCD